MCVYIYSVHTHIYIYQSGRSKRFFLRTAYDNYMLDMNLVMACYVTLQNLKQVLSLIPLVPLMPALHGIDVTLQKLLRLNSSIWRISPPWQRLRIYASNSDHIERQGLTIYRLKYAAMLPQLLPQACTTWC